MTARPSIARAIFEETRPFAAKTALAESPRSITYGALAEAVEAAARELSSRGVQRLERVALLCPDSIDHVVLSLAILSLDAAVVPIAPELMSDEQGAILARMDVHHLLADAARAPADAGELVAAGALARAFRLVRRTPCGEARAGYDELRPAFIRFSSGTTGTSKGVVLSHEAILARTEAANAGLGVTSRDVIAWVLSMSFHFVVTILLFLRKGATVLLCGDPMPGALVETLQRQPVTLLYASPLHYRLLTLSKALAPAHFSSLRLAVSTAVRLPAQVARDMRERFGVQLSEAYGIIEVGLPFIHRSDDAAQPGCLGRPLPAFEVRLAEDGEVLLRGQGLFDAYFAPWQPRARCQPDGWFHTGDLGELDADGGLRLVGRCKAVINFSGMKIFPQEVEEVLNQHPSVAESLVYGEPHAEYGQIPCAHLVMRDNAPLDEAGLRAFCRSRLALHKIPKAFARVDALPKTASGKLRRA